MPIIRDPDSIALTTDIAIDTTAKTIEIKTTGAISNAGSTGGISGQCLYSFLKEQWKSSATFIKFPFPMEAITPEQFEFLSGWKLLNDTSRNLVREAGWSEKSGAGAVLRKYMGVVSLGTIGGSDQPYFRWNTNGKTNFAFTGPVNQAVQIFGDASNGNFAYDDGGDTFTIYVREQGKTFSAATNASIGASTLSYITYRFPLSNATDLKISASDATIAANAPYTNISVEYFGTDQARNIDGTSAPFRIIVTDSAGTASTTQIYEKLQYLLRQGTDIDSGVGTVVGATADALASFLGDTLVGTTGLAIDGLNTNFLNAVNLFDKNGVARNYPFVSAGTLSFGSNAGSGDFKYWMYFATNPAGDFGTAGATIVNDSSGTPITGTYSGSPVSFSFAYDTNTQGGRTAGVTPAVKVVGIGLAGGQYTLVDASITRAAGQSVLLAPAQERNYSNP